MESNPRMCLTGHARREAEKAHKEVVEDFLHPKNLQSNVVGLGIGVKWTNGQPTGEPALIVLVEKKLPKNLLKASDIIPKKLWTMQTDVLAIGKPEAQNLGAQASSLLTARIRPAKGGYSVGHFAVSAGTIGVCISEPAGTETGIEQARYYILSNNHVLANSNDAQPGDPIVQPGIYDGGQVATDRIATLERFVPISFEPPVSRHQHQNTVDAAIARGNLGDLSREIHWIGMLRGWRRLANVEVGQLVQKTGRTTGYTIGRITAMNATVDVSYGGGRVARFHNQIVTTPMSSSGDSGSLITSLDNVAVALLFAGSPSATLANPIEYVRKLLDIEIAEQEA